ncbi:MAG: hypothetical protein HOA32_14270 [Nitrospina sp.]|jgi:hypothetical protein|nr:hypothetical protein [Nitrospina sp.]MBT6596038.1 hypothetical protein [Nitrospina sp.]MBT6902161.1 hypothetical protein [Nitrospina sp.]MBT7681764.1 hypothetical protein [Nitrospina sp.]MBT7934936.1 hypothetical protein [Nitrospina sp.]
MALGLMVLWVISASFIGYKVIYGNAKKVDTRVGITLLPVERDFVLSEMRLLLEGLQGIISGLANDNFEEVKVAARGSGMAVAQDVNPALILKLPLEFKTIGMGVHKSFDILADNIKGKSSREILNEVNSIMDSCVGCHATYKLEVERQ